MLCQMPGATPPTSSVPFPNILSCCLQADYLANLGINAVELLPVFEWDELEFQRQKNPRDHMVGKWAIRDGQYSSGCLGSACFEVGKLELQRQENPRDHMVGGWAVCGRQYSLR